MAKEHFDYNKADTSEYTYHGFHLKDGRYHIDTKRLILLKEDYCFPKDLFTAPRNTHYFVPKYKNENDWAINILLGTLNRLSRDWNEEYKTVIRKIETPKEVEEKVRINEIAMTSDMDDLDQIQEDAFFAGIRREAKYEKSY